MQKVSLVFCVPLPMAVVLEVHAALMGYRSCRPSGVGGRRQVLLEHREVTGYLEQWRILI